MMKVVGSGFAGRGAHVGLFGLGSGWWYKPTFNTNPIFEFKIFFVYYL